MKTHLHASGESIVSRDKKSALGEASASTSVKSLCKHWCGYCV